MNIRYIKEYKQQAIKKLSSILPMEIIDYIDDTIFNKNYTMIVCNIISTSLYVKDGLTPSLKDKIDSIIDSLEYYIKTKSYLTLNLEKVHYESLRKRNKLLNDVDKYLPKLFKRNNKELREPYYSVENELGYLIALYQQYSNRVGPVRNKIDSLISSSNLTLSELIDRFDTSNSNEEFGNPVTKEYMMEIGNDKHENFHPDIIRWNNENKYIVVIDNQEDLAEFASSSFWCHTYKDAYNAFHTYSRYDGVWILVDTDDTDERNLIVLTNECDGPDWFGEYELMLNNEDEYDDGVNSGNYDSRIFDMLNHSIDNPHKVFIDFFEDMNYEEIIEILELE